MKYPFANSNIVFRYDIKSFQELAKTDSPFDKDFPKRLPAVKAYDFDKITEKVCAYRSSKSKKLLHSADAFMILQSVASWDVGSKKPTYCFIEFKNQKVDNIQSIKEPDDNDLMKKAFDSLSVCAMTFTHGIPMAELQQQSLFIVVYPKQDYSVRFLEALNQLSSENGEVKPLWLLDKLENAGFFSKVLTIDDEQFRALPFFTH